MAIPVRTFDQIPAGNKCIFQTISRFISFNFDEYISGLNWILDELIAAARFESKYGQKWPDIYRYKERLGLYVWDNALSKISIYALRYFPVAPGENISTYVAPLIRDKILNSLGGDRDVDIYNFCRGAKKLNSSNSPTLKLVLSDRESKERRFQVSGPFPAMYKSMLIIASSDNLMFTMEFGPTNLSLTPFLSIYDEGVNVKGTSSTQMTEIPVFVGRVNVTNNEHTLIRTERTIRIIHTQVKMNMYGMYDFEPLSDSLRDQLETVKISLRLGTDVVLVGFVGYEYQYDENTAYLYFTSESKILPCYRGPLYNIMRAVQDPKLIPDTIRLTKACAEGNYTDELKELIVTGNRAAVKYAEDNVNSEIVQTGYETSSRNRGRSRSPSPASVGITRLPPVPGVNIMPRPASSLSLLETIPPPNIFTAPPASSRSPTALASVSAPASALDSRKTKPAYLYYTTTLADARRILEEGKIACPLRNEKYDKRSYPGIIFSYEKPGDLDEDSAVFVVEHPIAMMHDNFHVNYRPNRGLISHETFTSNDARRHEYILSTSPGNASELVFHDEVSFSTISGVMLSTAQRTVFEKEFQGTINRKDFFVNYVDEIQQMLYVLVYRMPSFLFKAVENEDDDSITPEERAKGVKYVVYRNNDKENTNYLKRGNYKCEYEYDAYNEKEFGEVMKYAYNTERAPF
jgi:hypothetical protein